MLTGIRWLTNEDTRTSVRDFFTDRKIPQGQKQLDQHLERLDVNAAFQTRVQQNLQAALQR